MASRAAIERAGRQLSEAMATLENSGASVGEIAGLVHIRAYALMAECCGPTAARDWALEMARQAIEAGQHTETQK